MDAAQTQSPVWTTEKLVTPPLTSWEGLRGLGGFYKRCLDKFFLTMKNYSVSAPIKQNSWRTQNLMINYIQARREHRRVRLRIPDPFPVRSFAGYRGISEWKCLRRNSSHSSCGWIISGKSVNGAQNSEKRWLSVKTVQLLSERPWNSRWKKYLFLVSVNTSFGTQPVIHIVTYWGFGTLSSSS